MGTGIGPLILQARSSRVRPMMSCRSSRLLKRRGLGSLNNRKNSEGMYFQLGKFLHSRCGEFFIWAKPHWASEASRAAGRFGSRVENTPVGGLFGSPLFNAISFLMPFCRSVLGESLAEKCPQSAEL